MRCSILTTPKDHMEAAYSLFAFKTKANTQNNFISRFRVFVVSPFRVFVLHDQKVQMRKGYMRLPKEKSAIAKWSHLASLR
jgi:hypothetical protein